MHVQACIACRCTTPEAARKPVLPRRAPKAIQQPRSTRFPRATFTTTPATAKLANYLPRYPAIALHLLYKANKCLSLHRCVPSQKAITSKARQSDTSNANRAQTHRARSSPRLRGNLPPSRSAPPSEGQRRLEEHHQTRQGVTPRGRTSRQAARGRRRRQPTRRARSGR